MSIKIKLISENADRLGLNNVETRAMDSRLVSENFKGESFDRVLVDAPCSGLGVLRKKPDIKYSKTLQDLQSLQTIQKSILIEASRLVKPGGLLVYSTCTVDKEENEGNVQEFLKEANDFEEYPLQLTEMIQPLVNNNRVQIFPQDFGGDGFFLYLMLQKEGEELSNEKKKWGDL